MQGSIQIDAKSIADNRRQIETASRVHEYLVGVERSKKHLEQLQEKAYTYNLSLQEVSSYDDLYDTAQRLSAIVQAYFNSMTRKREGPYIDDVPNAWQQVHTSIVQATKPPSARGSTSLRQQQLNLYLEPVTRPIPTSEQCGRGRRHLPKLPGAVVS